MNGLQSTLLQGENVTIASAKTMSNRLQIIHSRNNHWILGSNVNCELNVINVYDSVYSEVDECTKDIIEKQFKLHEELVIKVPRVKKQTGSNDCGLYAIAFATAIAHGLDPVKQKFRQSAMRAHLVNCFKQKRLSAFPTAEQS